MQGFSEQHSIKVEPDFKTLYHRMKDINDLSLKTITEQQVEIRRLRLSVRDAEAEARKPYADKIMQLEEAFVDLREALVKRDDRIEELEWTIRDYIANGGVEGLIAQVEPK